MTLKTVDFNVVPIFPITFDFTNITNGIYSGEIKGWNFNVIPLSSFNPNYVFTNFDDGRVEDNFILGVE